MAAINTVDLSAAPSGVTLDFSQTNNIAQQVFPTSVASDPYFGSTLRLNGLFQTLVGSPYGDSLSASLPGTTRCEGVQATIPCKPPGMASRSTVEIDHDQFILTNTAGTLLGGDGNDTFVGTLSNTQTTLIDGGDGDDNWNITGPSIGAKAAVTIVGGSGSNTVTASNITGKLAAQGANATGIVSEFGSTRSTSTLSASVNNSTNVGIFGGSSRNNAISVTNSTNVGIFGGGGDAVSLSNVTQATIEGGLFGGANNNSALSASLNNSSNVSIFGSSTTNSRLSASLNDSTNVSIFGGSRSNSLSVVNSTNVGIFGVSDGMIDIDAPVNFASEGIQIRISDFGSAESNPSLAITLNHSTDVSIFGSVSNNSARLSASVNNSSNVSIFGSASRNVGLSVINSTDVGIFGVVDGTISLGPTSSVDATAGVTRATIEAAEFGGETSNSSLSINLNNSTNVGIFGSVSNNSRALNALVNNSTNVSIFGGSVRGGILQVSNSTNVGIFAQSSASVDFNKVTQGNVFVETFGSTVNNNRLSISVGNNSTNVGIFGGSTRNASISVTNSSDVHIFGSTAINTIEEMTYVGDSVSFSGVTNSTIAAGVLGSVPPGDNTTPILSAFLDNSSNISFFGSARGTSSLSVVSSQDVSIYGGFGDQVDLLSTTRIRVEGGVFGSVVPNRPGLSISVAGNSTNVGIFGTSTSDWVNAIGGTNIGFDLRGGDDIVTLSNVNSVVGIADAGDDTVTVNSGSNMLLYLADGIDRASILGGSNIRVLGGDANDEFNVGGGSEIDVDGGNGADTLVSTGGSNVNLRSDGGADVLKLFSNVAGFINGGEGNDSVAYYGGSGTALAPGQIAVLIDGGAGNDTLEVRSLLSVAARNLTGQPDPFADLPSWMTLPTSITDPSLNQLPSSVALIGGDGNDSLYLEGNQRLFALGGDGNDSITFEAGSNSFALGGDGDDSISMNSKGVDNTVFGDAGNDSVTVSTETRLAVFTEAGDDTVEFYGGSQSYARTGDGNDNIQINGGGDGLVASTESGSDTLEVNGGNNILVGGGNDSDTMTVNNGTNALLLGEGGDDTLNYFGGDKPILSGGDGNDKLIANQRNADFYGDDGDDTYKINPILFEVPSIALRLRELQFINTDDFVSSSRGIDTMDLSEFQASSGGANVNFGILDGSQTLIANQVSVTLTGSFESIIGTDGNDTLTGTHGNNRLEGRGGHDTLMGLGGDDTLIGGTGNDILDGGNGDDKYLVETNTGISLGNDTIWENSNAGTDAVDFSGLPAGLNAFNMNLSTSQSLAGGLLNLAIQRSSTDTTVGEVEEVVGTPFSDNVIGNSLDNRFELLAGDDSIDGGSGKRHLCFPGNWARFRYDQRHEQQCRSRHA